MKYDKQIKTESDLIALITQLVREDKLYHCEDDARDAGLFTEAEATNLNERFKEAYELDFEQSDYMCPCDIALIVQAAYESFNAIFN